MLACKYRLFPPGHNREAVTAPTTVNRSSEAAADVRSTGGSRSVGTVAVNDIGEQLPERQPCFVYTDAVRLYKHRNE